MTGARGGERGGNGGGKTGGGNGGKTRRPAAAERVRALHDKWFIREPALLMVLASHESAANEGIRTIRCGKGRIEYNPAYLDTLDEAALEKAFKAEAIRILLRHPYRYPPRNGAVSYRASNITLNEYYPDLGIPYHAADFWPDPKHRRQNFEFYYRELMDAQHRDGGGNGGRGKTSGSAGAREPDGDQSDEAAAAAGAGTQTQDTGDGQNGEAEASSGGAVSGAAAQTQNADGGKSGTGEAPASGGTEENNGAAQTQSTDSEENDAGEMSPDDSAAAQTQEIDREAENAELWSEDNFYDEKTGEIIEYIRQNNVSWGSVKGKLSQAILATLKPEVDYRKILSGFRSTVLSSARCLTRFKPSRRYGFLYMGNRRAFTTSLLVGVDVSGSITDKQLSAFFSVINRFFKYGIERVEVQQFDAELQGPPAPLKKARKTVQVQGRGDTSFDPLIAFFIENRRRYDGLIIFTDGDADIPEVPPQWVHKILWICACKEDYEQHQSWMRKRGRCCWIKKL